jgi:hypothetical protein
MTKQFLAAAALSCVLLPAVETKTWTQTEASEFEKGVLQGLALASNGRLTLAPVFDELFDPGVPHLWSVAVGKDGTVFAGGAEGRVFVIDSAGKGRLLVKLDGGAVYALAAQPNGDLLAAVSPDARIFRIDAKGQATLLHTSTAKYIWALWVEQQGTLLAATGEPGQIHRIGANGQAAVVFDSGEAHVRSLTADGKGSLVVGTEPGGLVIRVDAAGKGFILHQTGKREVTALTLGADGTIWAAASGRRSALPLPAPVPAPAIPAQPRPAAAPAAPGQPTPTAAATSTPPPTMGPNPAALAGGSEIWRILPDGEPRLAWSHSQDVVYALALDGRGRTVAGTGNQGLVIRIESDSLSTRIADAEPSQVTALAVLPSGALAVAAANPGRLYRLGPQLQKDGSIESDVLDAGMFTYWGRLRYEAELRGGSVTLETRSGNTERPGLHWSAYQPVRDRVASPSARFLGWRATLKAAPDGQSPELSLVEVAYQSKNVAPAVELVEMTPMGYRFPQASALSSSGSTLTLPPIGQPRRSTPPAASAQPSGSVTMNSAHSWRGARWKAADPNGDSLQFKLEIRGVEEREWKLLKSELEENRYSWDTTAFADGRYRLRVTATDQADNYPGQGLTASAESEPFVIDNTPPEVRNLTARIEGTKIRLRFQAADALSALASAEYSINGGAWVAVAPTTGITDSSVHDYAVEVDKPAGAEFTIAVKVVDEGDNVAVHKTVLR